MEQERPERKSVQNLFSAADTGVLDVITAPKSKAHIVEHFK
jgi:hypothetical protein